ncbi:FAD/NAD(P)-binding protein [Pseudophaeobacter sp.]|uniref:FAD/NAD(P)-binding protein n=1 Tax=Pseudophaeobacter sp. TaxID=1971739 RepID=UPI003296DB21
MAPKHVAIVGCGFAGTSAFYQIVDQYPVEELTIFERSGVFGPGYPYRPEDCPDYLLNNTTDTLCLTPRNRRAFYTWLQSRPEYGPDLDPCGNLPRRVFGEFLSEAFEAARLMAAVKGIKVTLVPKEATVMEEHPDGRVRIGWGGGETTVDAALLTTGRCPDVDPFPAPPEGANATYIANHICTDAFDTVGLDATVHILGASLSSYDVINRLFSPETGCRFTEAEDGNLTFEPGPNNRHVVLCSRSGRLKALQSQKPMDIQRTHFTPEGLTPASGTEQASLADVAAAILQEAEDHGVTLSTSELTDPYAGCADAEAVNSRAGQLLDQAIAASTEEGRPNFLVDLFSDAQIDLWDGWASDLLRTDAKAQYRSKFETAFLSYSAPCPLSTARRLQALHKAGRLTVRNGTKEVYWSETEHAYHLGHAHGVDIVQTMVNTTGSLVRDLTSTQQPPLVQSLVSEGLLGAPAGESAPGAAVDMKTFRSNSARNIYVANMMLWGPGFFTSSAFMMALVVEKALSGLFALEPVTAAS